jgi:hypothetical protein
MLDLSNKTAPTAAEHSASFSDLELCVHYLPYLLNNALRCALHVI